VGGKTNDFFTLNESFTCQQKLRKWNYWCSCPPPTYISQHW